MTPLAQTVLSLIEEGWHFCKSAKAIGGYYNHNHDDCASVTKRLLDALKESEE